MDGYVKRLMDLVLALVGLVLAAPLMAFVALAVRLDSPGRAIFSQERLGQHGRVFRMHKFRKFPACWGDRGAGVTVTGDARMTRLGRFLERSKLDELPQLWNILKGEMSFVGPRPETLRFADLFQGELKGVHDFLPGIFGPNQVAFRNESKMYPPDRDPETFYREELFPQKARRDIAYFSRSTPLSDLLWIARGVWFSVAGAVDWRSQLRLRGPVFLVDFVAVQLAWTGANLVRFEALPAGVHWGVWMTGLWLMPLVVLPVIALGGSYAGAVRHYAVGDLLRLLRSSVAGWTLAFIALLAFYERNAALGLLPMALLAAVTISATARVVQRERVRRDLRRSRQGVKARLLIYGAGHRGAALATLLEHGFSRAQVVGFLDDRVSGQMVSGRPVLGAERDLDTVHAVHDINQLWITFDPERHKYDRLLSWSQRHGVKIVVLPALDPFFSLLERRRASPDCDVRATDMQPAAGSPRPASDLEAEMG
jgi:lipopolysaccharide/colanic/teichoic acid biosynthesis glycosyltransferase